MATEYGKLNRNARVRLKQSDSKRYTKIKAEHEAAEEDFRVRIKNAKTHADKCAVRAEFAEFLAEDVVSGVTAEEVSRHRAAAEASRAVANAIKAEQAEETRSRGSFRR